MHVFAHLAHLYRTGEKLHEVCCRGRSLLVVVFMSVPAICENLPMMGYAYGLRAYCGLQIQGNQMHAL
jgi:hypothetical protein